MEETETPKRGRKPNAVGHPRIRFKKEVIDKVKELAYKYLSYQDIARLSGIPFATINKRFKDIIETERARYRENIKGHQQQRARAGDATMLVWLGKNDLGQTDKAPVDNNVNLTVEVVSDTDKAKETYKARLARLEASASAGAAVVKE